MSVSEAKWYIIHTYSGYENKVATSIEKIVELRNLSDLILEVRVPMEKVIEIKNNEQVEIERKLFPGYVLLHMVVNDDTWILIKGIRGVTGFVGPEGKPIPLTDEEMATLKTVDKNCRLIKGQVFLWPGATDWRDLWDMDGTITK